MDVEELGSVYESLLDFEPEIPPSFLEFQLSAGTERKATGSYYTPPPLVRELISSALEPVLEDRLATAKTPEEKEAALLDLKICDPAAGSGHFLLAAARRLARRLATIRNGDAEPSPRDYQMALRDVIRSCLYAVDLNPLAVDLCKVALWIEGHAADCPLSFLDHRIKNGNALIGVADLQVLTDGIPDGAYKPLSNDDRDVANDLRKRNRAERKGQESLFGGRSGVDIEGLAEEEQKVAGIDEVTPDDVHHKAQSYAKLRNENKDYRRYKIAADLWCTAFFTPKTPIAEIGEDHTPTTNSVLGALGENFPSQRMLEHVEDLANKHLFFHWPLEFPGVFEAGGFDVLLGNPPWDVYLLREREFFGSRKSEIAALAGANRKKEIQKLKDSDPSLWQLFVEKKHERDAANQLMRTSGRFHFTAHGTLNAYGLFAETFLNLLRGSGRAGFIVPTGIATDDSSKLYFDKIMSGKRLINLYDFENREKIFPSIDSRIKFSLLTLGQSKKPAIFSSFLTRADQLAEKDRQLILSHEDIAHVNPNTRTYPIFRSQADAELTKKIYISVPVIMYESKVEHDKAWDVALRYGLFHMTSDSDLFYDYKNLENAGAKLEKSRWCQVTGECWRPLLEAKMIHQHDCRWATYEGNDKGLRDVLNEEKNSPDFRPLPRYWVSDVEVEQRLKSVDWEKKWLMGVRRITGATNERTVIACIMPRTAIGASLQLMFPNGALAGPKLCAALLASLNSIPADYAARQKVGGTDVTHMVLKQFAVPSPEMYSAKDLDFIVPRVLELTYVAYDLEPFARDLGYEGEPFAWDPERRAVLRAELDAYYAYLYGLTRDELCYILDPADVMGPDYPSETFRVLKRNEMREFGEYRTQRLVLDAWDRFCVDGTFDPAQISTDTCLPIPEERRDDALRRQLAEAENKLAALEIQHEGDRTPILFVEGVTDARIVEAAWSAFYPDRVMPFRTVPSAGTKQMQSLASPGGALQTLIKGRTVCALADNDGPGRALWKDGHLHKGDLWKRQTNGVHWCLLRPTDEFVAVMEAQDIPKACWPFTVESCFSAGLRRSAMEAGTYVHASEMHADFFENSEVSRRLFLVPQGLGETDHARFYLYGPDPDCKEAFAEWVTAPERCTPENYAAFETLLERLVEQVLGGDESPRTVTDAGNVEDPGNPGDGR